MSQHTLRGSDGRYLIRLGWESCYKTFFLQVIDTQDGNEEEDPEYREPFLWLGSITQPAILTLEPILKAVAPYAVISDELQELVRCEQAEDLAQVHSTDVDPEIALIYEYQLVTGAQELFEARNYDEALAVLEKVFATNPQAVAAVVIKAGIESELGEREEEQRASHIQRAIDLYSQAIELANAQGYAIIIPRLRVGLGLAFAKADQIEEAQLQYDQALEIIASGTTLDLSDEALALEAKADLLLYRKHNPVGAIPYYERAAQLNPENEAVRYNLGLTRFAQRQRHEASDL